VYIRKIYNETDEFLGLMTFSIPERYFFSYKDINATNVISYKKIKIINMTDYTFTNDQIALICQNEETYGYYGFAQVYRSRVPGFPFPVTVAGPGAGSYSQIRVITLLAIILFISAAFILLREIRKIVKKEIAGKQAQIIALQHQINPHFIYNTMEVFSSKMKIYGHYSESDAMVAFARIFRYNVNTKDDLVPVREEILQANNYVSIQNLSYPLLRLETDIPEDVLNERMLRFVFQPLIENSILHSGYERDQAIRVIISARLNGGNIIFTVADNGKGLPQEAYDKINASLTGEQEKNVIETVGKSLGLKNINTRLRLFYGGVHGLAIKRVGEDNCVSFTIKKLPAFP
jgi:hypothetical protein